MALTDRHRQYWRRNVRITLGLLTVWFFVSFVLIFFARDLRFPFFGWPFSFWVAAQGALVVYLLVVVFYTRFMDRLDRQYRVQEEGEEESR